MNRAVFLLCGMVFLSATGSIQAAPPGFSGDFYDESSVRPDKVLTGRIYVQGESTRREAIKNGKVTEIMIHRLDKNVTWILNPATKTYLEMKGGSGKLDAAGVDEQIKQMAEVKQLGEEKVNGYLCRKIQYVYKNKSLGTMTSWIAIKLNYMLKMEMKSSYAVMKQEIKNIKEGRQDAKLFELPSGYKKTAMPGR